MFFKKWYIILALFTVSASCNRPAYTKLYSAKLEHFDTSVVASDPAIEALIAPYKMQIDSQMNTVVGYCGMEMVKNRPESALGNAVCDMLIRYTREKLNLPVDLCIMNFGGLRTPLPKGPIVKGKVFELMPFDNTLVLLKLDKKGLPTIAQTIASKGGEPIGSPHGAKVKSSSDGYTLTFDREPDTSEIWILTSNYLADGGDGYDFAGAIDRKETNVLIRDAMISYFEEHTSVENPLTAKIENRINLN